MTCSARRQGDQMACGKCGLQWDVNDRDPPECPNTRDVGERLRALRESLESPRHK